MITLTVLIILLLVFTLIAALVCLIAPFSVLSYIVALPDLVVLAVIITMLIKHHDKKKNT